MDNPYQSPSTDEGSDGSENARGSFGQVFGGYRDCDMSGEMNDPTTQHCLSHGTGMGLAFSSTKRSLKTYLILRDTKATNTAESG